MKEFKKFKLFLLMILVTIATLTGTQIVKAEEEDDIKFYIRKSDNFNRIAEYTDPSNVKGLSWDEERNILTMDNFECTDMGIYSHGKHKDITIIVKNNNKLTSLRYGVKIYNLDVKLIGDGSINMTNGFTTAGNEYEDDFLVDNRGSVIIDGPYLNIYDSNMILDDFILKSGHVDMRCCWLEFRGFGLPNELKELQRAPAIQIFDKLEISGGSIYINTGESLNEFDYYDAVEIYPAISYYGYKVTPNVYIENSTFIFVDADGDEEGLIGNYNSRSDYIDMSKFENIIYEYYTDESQIKRILIDKYDVKLSDNSFKYNGKAHTPKVKLGGLFEGVDYKVTYENNIEVGNAKIHIKGIGFYTGEKTVEFEIIEEKITNEANKNTTSTDHTSDEQTSDKRIIKDKNFIYKILKESITKNNYGKVEVIGFTNNKIKKLKIKNVIKYNGKKYKITSIGKNVFKNNKKFRSVTIGKYVTKIGSKAFYNCKKLSNVVIKSNKLIKIGKKAFFKKGKGTIKISAPNKKKKAYKKLLKYARCKKIVM